MRRSLRSRRLLRNARGEQELGVLRAELCAVLVLHLDDLKEFTTCVASSVPDFWSDAPCNDVTDERRHEVRELSPGTDAAFGGS